MGKAMLNIIDTAKEDGRFSLLLEAIRAAGIENVLAAEGPFTVFAPTDRAFGRIPKPVFDDILSDRKKIADLLTYHVVAERLTANDLMGMDSVRTSHGDELSIEASADCVVVNDEQVIQADIECTNGIIHALDTVLVPRSAEAWMKRSVQAAR
jgi:uncharacterized surface protein with fasciclin (FAS1) repeats